MEFLHQGWVRALPRLRPSQGRSRSRRRSSRSPRRRSREEIHGEGISYVFDLLGGSSQLVSS